MHLLNENFCINTEICLHFIEICSRGSDDSSKVQAVGDKPFVTLTNDKQQGTVNIKTVFPRYEDSHFKDKTVVRSSYL